MMFKKLIPAILLLFVALTMVAQTTRVDCERMVEDDQFQKSQSILPIYKYENDSIEPYSKFGVAQDKNIPWYRIKKFPDMSTSRDTGYTYIYFAGADNEFNQAYLLCLLGNYVRSTRSVLFYVDRNNDMDLSNDGPPDTLKYHDHSITLHFTNVNAPEAHYAIKLTRFNYGENIRYKNLLTEHYQAHSGSKKFTNINFCYREQRYNTIAAYFNNGRDSFTLGIKDMNVNGLYDEAYNDKLYLGPYHSTIVNTELFDLQPTIADNTFEWNGRKFNLFSIESTGKFVEIKEDPNAVLHNKLKKGKKVPDFSYMNILNVAHRLKEYKKDEIYLFFWDIDNLSREDTLYLGKIYREYSDQIKLITLNHGDEPRQVRITYYYDKLSWPVGYSNTSIARSYFMEDVNRGYYIGKKRKLINDKISPEEMYKLLDTKP